MYFSLQIKAEKAAAETEGGTLGGPREVGGFDFDRLIERKPALRQELLTFRDQLLAATSDEQTLKAGLLSASCVVKSKPLKERRSDVWRLYQTGRQGFLQEHFCNLLTRCMLGRLISQASTFSKVQVFSASQHVCICVMHVVFRKLHSAICILAACVHAVISLNSNTSPGPWNPAQAMSGIGG